MRSQTDEQQQLPSDGHKMISSPDIVESAARFLLAAGWRPDPEVSGSVLHDERSKRVALAVWRRMEFLLEPADKAAWAKADFGSPAAPEGSK